tara:strand:+ start:89965 stop:90297 length:333 start_codon:yes stop_codon:yes gene_type:complete
MKKIKNLCAVHRAIKTQIKGSTPEIAKQVGLSRSCFYKYIEGIENFGAEVAYSRTARCFSYQSPFELKLEINAEGMNQIYGGRNFLPSTKNGRKGFMFGISKEDDHLNLK